MRSRDGSGHMKAEVRLNSRLFGRTRQGKHDVGSRCRSAQRGIAGKIVGMRSGLRGGAEADMFASVHRPVLLRQPSYRCGERSEAGEKARCRNPRCRDGPSGSTRSVFPCAHFLEGLNWPDGSSFPYLVCCARSARHQSDATGCHSSTRFPSGSVNHPNFPKS